MKTVKTDDQYIPKTLQGYSSVSYITEGQGGDLAHFGYRAMSSEEETMEKKFGNKYNEYKKNVRRWI